MPNPYEVITEMKWHHFRPSSFAFAQPPEGVIDPCGGCGRAESEHPYPTGTYSAKDVYDLALRVVRCHREHGEHPDRTSR